MASLSCSNPYYQVFISYNCSIEYDFSDSKDFDLDVKFIDIYIFSRSV